MSATLTFSGQPSQMADPINALPTDQNPPSPGEVQLLDTLFKKQQTTVQKILSETKDVMLVGILFCIFSVPGIDSVISKIVPSVTTSVYISIGIRALCVMLVYFLIKNMYLVRKN